MIELGGNIRLMGFKEVDSGSMVVLKKIIGNYARKISERIENFEGLEVTLKKIHDNGIHSKFEVHSKAVNGGHYNSCEVVDRNLFVCVDSSLKKVLNMVSR